METGALPFFSGPPPSKLGFVAKPDMPPHINILFRARPPLDQMAVSTSAKKLKRGIDPVYQTTVPIEKDLKSADLQLHPLLSRFEDGPPPARVVRPTKDELAKVKREEDVWKHYQDLRKERREWDPLKNEKATENPKKTIFVGRLDYATDEKELERSFEKYGRVASSRIVKDSKGKSRGYGFVEFKHRGDADEAYRRGNGMWIDNRRVITDREKGRTDKDWLPRRLGGGDGETRYSRADARQRREIIKKFKLKERDDRKLKEPEQANGNSSP